LPFGCCPCDIRLMTKNSGGSENWRIKSLYFCFKLRLKLPRYPGLGIYSCSRGTASIRSFPIYIINCIMNCYNTKQAQFQILCNTNKYSFLKVSLRYPVYVMIHTGIRYPAGKKSHPKIINTGTLNYSTYPLPFISLTTMP